MRRITRRYLTNLLFFGSALLLILHLNRDQSNNDAPFAWTTVRYKTSSQTLPKAHGICPGLASTNKPALVVSRVEADGDASWLTALADKYHLCIYTADASAALTEDSHLRVPANRGHEAMAYLTFLIDNYSSLPAAGAVFIHGARWAWHNDAPDYDNAALLAALNVSAALAGPSPPSFFSTDSQTVLKARLEVGTETETEEGAGYANLRCDWSAGTCPPTTSPQRSLETALSALLEPWNVRAASDAALPAALASLFGSPDSDSDSLDSDSDSPDSSHADEEEAQDKRKRKRTWLSRTDAIRAQCCAQFAVSRTAMRRHSRAEYTAVRQWLLDTTRGAAPADDRVAGRVLSYVWHVLFLGVDGGGGSAGVQLARLNARACPRADECYCRLYGRCALEGCDGPGRCRGQYRVPEGYRLPEGWAAGHS